MTPEIRYIRKEYEKGKISQRKLAAKFGIKQSKLGLIVHRKIYKEIL
jgi:predicted transcriptional regulator